MISLLDTLITDVDCRGTANEPPHFMLGFEAKGAIEGFFFAKSPPVEADGVAIGVSFLPSVSAIGHAPSCCQDDPDSQVNPD
jgi:hypothetical protein